MTSQTDKAKAKLATLSSSFDDLEALLDPLFAQTLPETVVGLEPLQQAKLQTVVPYLVYDLVFIYLKSRGIDPKTHPVVSELDRVKQYFQKISAAENPPTKRIEVDKGAAQRFIKHAIAQATSAKDPATAHDAPTPGPPPVRVQAKITSKMLERQLYEKNLKEEDAQESEEEALQIFDNPDELNSEANPTLHKTGKAEPTVAETMEPVSKANTKRRRPTLDPFAGYGDDSPAALASSYPDIKQKPSRPKKKRAVESASKESSAAVASNAANSAQPNKAKKAKKKEKKTS